MIDWRERLREVDRRVDDRVGTAIIAPIVVIIWFVFFLWLFMPGSDDD